MAILDQFSSSFGFSNAGKTGNTLQAIGAGINLVSQFGAASALESAGATTLQTGAMNRDILYKRAATADKNAKYIRAMGTYEATMLRREAEINDRIGAANYAETMRAADVTLQSGRRTLELAGAKAKEFGVEAGAMWGNAITRSLRQYQEGRGVLGEQRVATAKAGFTMEGSELDALVENATRLELGRLDELKTAAEQVRQTRFAGSMALYEGQSAAFDAGERYRALTFTAASDKYNSDVQSWNAEQMAQVKLAESSQSAWNMEQQAKDYRRQGDLALAEARARQAAMEEEAKGGRRSGILGALKTAAAIVAAPATGGASLALM